MAAYTKAAPAGVGVPLLYVSSARDARTWSGSGLERNG